MPSQVELGSGIIACRLLLARLCGGCPRFDLWQFQEHYPFPQGIDFDSGIICLVVLVSPYYSLSAELLFSRRFEFGGVFC